MVNYNLSAYEFQLRARRSNFLQLTDLIQSEATEGINHFRNQYNSTVTMAEVFRDYCEDWFTNSPVIDSERGKLLKPEPHPQNSNRPYVELDNNSNTVEGVFGYGSFGTENNVVDSGSGTQRTSIDETEATTRPINFLFHTPDRNPRQAVLVLEEVDNVGAKGIVDRGLSEQLSDDFTHKLPSVRVPEKYARIRQADEIVSVRLDRTNQLPNVSPDSDELTDTFSNIFNDDMLSETITFTPSQRSVSSEITIDVDFLENLIESADDDENPFRFKVDEDNSIVLDDVRVTVKRAGSENTINLRDEEVKIGRKLNSSSQRGGYPEPVEVSESMRQFVTDEVPFAGGLGGSGDSLL